MAIKVDLEKAYDQIEWNFLETIIKAVGFDDKMSSLIMFGIQSATPSVTWKGNKLSAFQP